MGESTNGCFMLSTKQFMLLVDLKSCTDLQLEKKVKLVLETCLPNAIYAQMEGRQGNVIDGFQRALKEMQGMQMTV